MSSPPAVEATGSAHRATAVHVLLACGVFIGLVFLAPAGLMTLLDWLFPTPPGATVGDALSQGFAVLGVVLVVELVILVLVARWAKEFAGLRWWWAPVSLLLALAVGYVLADVGLPTLPAYATPLLVAPFAMPRSTGGRERGIVLLVGVLAVAILLAAGLVNARREHNAKVRNLEAHGVPLMAPTGLRGKARSVFTMDDGVVNYTWAETDSSVFEVRLRRSSKPDSEPSQVDEFTVRCVREGAQIEVVRAGESIQKLSEICRAMRPVSADWMIRSEEQAYR